MKAHRFPEYNAVFAKDQPQYMQLPAFRLPGPQGTVICCWKLDWKERWKLLTTGLIWHTVLTFNQALQPQQLSVDKPREVTGMPDRSPDT